LWAATLEAERSRRNPNAYTDEDIQRVRAEVATNGYAFTSGGVIPGVSSIAAPVYSLLDAIPLTVAVVFPTEVVHEDELEQVKNQLLNITRKISSELGMPFEGDAAIPA
jgi:DNA-binding IclR family transcriptional regulator